MTIIVTGGAGFIGSNFVFHMLEKYPDYRIVCVDKLTYAGNLSTLAPVMDNPNFRFCKIDICDREAIYQLFEEEHPDMVVNFAAESHVDRSIENPEVFLDTNIKGTAVMMDACRKYGIQRYHQVSTDEVYGDLPLDRPDLFFTEETPIHTSSPYSSSKAGADLLVLAYHRTYGLPVTISRCSNNYGPYHFPEKLIPLMIANALADKPLPVYGEGLNVRDWLYVEDHCRAIDLIIHKGEQWAGEGKSHPSGYKEVFLNPVWENSELSSEHRMKHYNQINDIVFPALDKVWTGEQTVQDALDKVMPEVDKIFDGVFGQ